MSLKAYHRKRDFNRSPEPAGEVESSDSGHRFAVQHHEARHDHYDFRLELDGVLKSWAVPKGPSRDPRARRLAVEVEDHPLEYAEFEGVIPKGEYGGGTVMLWDRGQWTPLDDDPAEALRRGKLRFRLDGRKLKGEWSIVRMKPQTGERRNNWLLMKRPDADAKAGDGDAILKAEPLSAASGRSMAQIAKSPRSKWTDGGAAAIGGDDPRRLIQDQVAGLPSARRRSMPADLRPQLAASAATPPTNDGWVHEIKLDGYRMLIRIEAGEVRATTRSGNDWTDRLGADLLAVFASLPVDRAVIDGELVALDGEGRSSFQRLQRAFKARSATPLHFVAFDLPHCAGYDLTGCTLLDRKAVLQRLVDAGASDRLRFSEHMRVDGGRMLERACGLGVEGIVSKRAAGRYVGRRSDDWIKVKCVKRQEFAVVGYTPPSGSRTALGALMLGVRENGDFRYCGKVGTGFTEPILRDLKRRLTPDRVAQPSVVDPPRGAAVRGAVWVTPRLAAEVRFAEWTTDGSLRHPVFLGLREDKTAADAVREPIARVEATRSGRTTKRQTEAAEPLKRTDKLTIKPKAGRPGNSKRTGRDAEEAEVAGVRLTHPDRVYYPELGLTKRDLAEFYVSVAHWVLPFVVDRPLTLVRCPKGRGESCFYQRHFNESMPPGVRSVTVRDEKGRGRYVHIGDLRGLIGLVQIGTLEVHPWGCRVGDQERPDVMVFDLDPGEGVTVSRLCDGARRVRDILDEVGLRTFVRTTGGKGLHVVAPLTPEADFDTVKRFAKAVASLMARREPKRYVAVMTKSRRTGRIYVDYLRNGRGATAVASYTTRARPGAPVATPLRWDELGQLRSTDAYTVANLGRRLGAVKADPWDGFDKVEQTIAPELIKAITD